MQIEMCDICKKEIKERADGVHAGYGWWANHVFCLECGKPVYKFLKKNGLVKDEK